MGHLYCACLTLLVASRMYNEIMQLKRSEEKDKRNKFAWIDRYYLGAFLFFIVPKIFLRRYLVEPLINTGALINMMLYDYHNLFSFSFFILGFLLFVISLDKGSYRY